MVFSSIAYAMHVVLQGGSFGDYFEPQQWWFSSAVLVGLRYLYSNSAD